jgi:hypothetical protein
MAFHTKTIDISSAIKELLVFDDPEYCDGKEGKCERLKTGQCFTFLDHETNFNSHKTFTRKSDECKAAYQEVKEQQKQRGNNGSTEGKPIR